MQQMQLWIFWAIVAAFIVCGCIAAWLQLAVRPKTESTERVIDAGRPVHAGDDLAPRRGSCLKTLAMNTEREFDHAGDAIGLAQDAIVGECLGIAPCAFHQPVKVLPADNADVHWPRRLGVLLERG